MLNFRNIGCKIGEDTLNVRLRMLKNKKDNEDKVKQKKDNVLLEQKQKYNKIQSEIKEKNIPIGSLSICWIFNNQFVYEYTTFIYIYIFLYT